MIVTKTPYSRERFLMLLGDRSVSMMFTEAYCGYQSFSSVCDIPLRRIPDHLVFFLSAGTGRIKMNSAHQTIRPGTVVWFQPDSEHGLFFEKNATRYTLRFRLVQTGQSICLDSPPIVQKNAWHLQDHFTGLIHNRMLDLPYSDSALRSMFALLSIEVFRSSGEQQQRPPRLGAAQCDQILRFVHSRIIGRIQPGDMAAVLRLSPDYFTRVFTRTFGISPRKWLLRERIRCAARDLLHSSCNITELAYEYGYEDIYLFSRQFKRVTGLSPTAYRNRHANKGTDPV